MGKALGPVYISSAEFGGLLSVKSSTKMSQDTTADDFSEAVTAAYQNDLMKVSGGEQVKGSVQYLSGFEDTQVYIASYGTFHTKGRYDIVQYKTKPIFKLARGIKASKVLLEATEK